MLRNPPLFIMKPGAKIVIVAVGSVFLTAAAALLIQ